MAFNIYKAVRVQKETSARRVQKHGMSTQKYHFKNVKPLYSFGLRIDALLKGSFSNHLQCKKLVEINNNGK